VISNRPMSAHLRERVEAEANRILRARVERLRGALEEMLAATVEPLSVPLTPGEWGAAGGAAQLQVLKDAIDSIARRESQREILASLIDAAAAIYPRAAVFILKSGTLSGWGGLGFLGEGGIHSEQIARVALGVSGDHLLARAVAAGAAARAGVQGAGKELLGALGGVMPGDACAVPVLVRGRPVAVLYGDTGSSPEGGDPLALEIVARIAGLAMEKLASPQRHDRADTTEIARTGVTRTTQRSAAAGSPAPPEEAELQAILADLGGNLRTRGADDGMSDDDRRRQADARRFANLLVSELLLYHEPAVIQGRKHHDLSTRLHKEIERSRQAFANRFPTLGSGSTDFFSQELVRLLAQGDPALLGN